MRLEGEGAILIVAKLPYLPLYTGDWLKDSALTRCTPAARGVWIDLLCVMHDDNRSGEVRGTIDEVARLARCTADELSHALTDIQNKRAAEVVQRGDEVCIRNRRMYRESQKRKSNAERQERHRKQCRNGEGNAGVAFEDDTEIENHFILFWDLYPRKVGKRDARGAWEKAIVVIRQESQCSTSEAIEVIAKSASLFAQSPKGKGEFCPHPATWLNQGRYEDDPAAWTDRKDSPQQKIKLSEIGKK
jgi:hypothetical protein